jgi:hypothetical protein
MSYRDRDRHIQERRVRSIMARQIALSAQRKTSSASVLFTFTIMALHTLRVSAMSKRRFSF